MGHPLSRKSEKEVVTASLLSSLKGVNRKNNFKETHIIKSTPKNKLISPFLKTQVEFRNMKTKTHLSPLLQPTLSAEQYNHFLIESICRECETEFIVERKREPRLSSQLKGKTDNLFPLNAASKPCKHELERLSRILVNVRPSEEKRVGTIGMKYFHHKYSSQNSFYLQDV